MNSATAYRTLVLGGVRSGKSRWAEEQFRAEEVVEYIATAAGTDDQDWALRVSAHRDRRPHSWLTRETLDLSAVLRADAHNPRLVDDLGNWVARTIDITLGWDGDLSGFQAAADELVQAWSNYTGRIVLVSNEVGYGVHPPTRAGRLFQDALGRMNTELAAAADEVVLVVAGIPLWLKRPAATR